MATQTTVQSSDDVANQQPVNAGGKPKTNKIIIGKPFEAGGRADNVIKFIQVDGGPRLISGWKIRNGSRVEVFGRGLERYNQIALWIGGGRELITGGDVRRKSGGEGLEFTARFGSNLYTDGLPIEVEFLQHNRPDNDRTLEKRFFYLKETKEEADKRKAREAAGGGGGKGAGGGQGLDPFREFVDAGLSPLGAIADAFKSTTGVFPAATKASGATTASATKKSTTDETLDEGDDQIETSYEEGAGGGPATSTSEIFTGGRTISEAGTVSAGGKTIAQGSTGVKETISSGGTVGSVGSASVGASGQVTSTGGGQIGGGGGGTVAGSVGVQREVSSTVQGGSGTIAGSAMSGGGGGEVRTEIHGGGGGASGTANIGGRIISSGQTSVGGTVAGQMTSTGGAQGAGVEEKVEVESSLKGKLEADAEIKTEVKASQAPGSGGSAQPQAPVAAPAPSASTPTQGSSATPPTQGSTIASGGTAAMGMGLPTFSGGTMPSAPAGLGRMKEMDAARNLNISSGGTAAPPATGKPAEQGGAGAPGAPGASDGKETPAGEGAGEPPTKPGETKPEESPTSPEAGEGKGLPTEKPAPGQEPAKEAKPPSEAPPGPPGATESPKKDDTAVPPPLGPDRRTPEGSGGSADNKDKPIDAANGGPNKDNQPSPSSPVGGGGQPLATPPQAGKPQPLGGPSGSGPVGPPSESNRDKGNVFRDPRSAGDMFSEALKGDVGPNPAAYPAARRKIDSAAKQALVDKGLGKAAGATTSKIWYYGFGSSCATFFTGLDFMLGAIVMDAYWIFGHKKNKELFPLTFWQKIVTVFATVFPPILWAFFIAIVMVAGCSWPSTNSAFNKKTNYKATVVGAFIGDSCKYFDLSNFTSSASNTTSATPAATIPAANGPITPR